MRARAARGAPQLVLASVFPLLGAELHAAPIGCRRAVSIPIATCVSPSLPPPHTVAHLSAKVIDGYCVGEPWNQRAVALGIGRVALTGTDLWRGMPEKVLGVNGGLGAAEP